MAVWTPVLAQVKDLPCWPGTAHHVVRVMERALGGAAGQPGAAPSGLGVSDTPISCSGDFKKFERISSSGTMSSSEELVDQEGGAGASAFEQGKGPLTLAVRGEGFRLCLWAWS